VRTDVAVEIEACPEHVWAVLTDVSRWPQWTSAVREVRLLDGSALGPGGVVRIRAAGLPDRTWRVSEFSRHRAFTWAADGLGARARVAFTLRRVDDRAGAPRTRLVIVHERSGPVAAAVLALTSRATARHLHALAEGLRLRCEQRRPAPVDM
jgi:uncharacterized protein YndB with AHSA1/START domain